jgi:chromate transporter
MPIRLPRRTVSLRQLADVFAWKANATFGGGTATVAVLREDIVEKRRWLSTSETDLSFALSRLTPGTNLLAFCAGIGWRLRGFAGATVALIAGSVPSAIFALLVTLLYEYWSRLPLMQIAMRGAAAATVSVMVATGVTLLRPYFRKASPLKIIFFAGGAFLVSQRWSVGAFYVLLIAAVLGFYWPQKRSE